MIFSPSKCTIRRLTLQELAIAVDISEDFLPPLGFRTHKPQLKGAPFYKTAPLRLLSLAIAHWSRTEIQRPRIINLPPPGDHVGGFDYAVTVPSLSWPKTSAQIWKGASSAAKSDKAEALYALWDERVWELPHCQHRRAQFGHWFDHSPLTSLRDFLLRIGRRLVLQSLLRYLKTTHKGEDSNEAQRDMEIGRRCLRHAAGADWFEWTAGSTPFFWRWSAEARSLIRDGHPSWFCSHPQHFQRPQRSEHDETIRDRVREKLANVRFKRYIASGAVLSLTSYFAVPKGEEDIRIVYDATAQG